MTVSIAGYQSVFRILAAAALMLAAINGSAQTYPSKPIRIVVPYPAGGAIDVTSRIIGKRISEELGQPVIVDNRPGAGGAIGTQLVAKAAADGYTLLMGNTGPNTINPSLYTNLGYNAETDFAPISVVVTTPFFVVVPASSSIRTPRDMITLGTSQNGTLNFGSHGNGSLSHLGGEMFNQASGSSFVHIPYKGSAPLIAAVISGEVQWAFLSGVDSVPQIKAGKMRPIAVASAARSPFAPDTPSMRESLPGFDLTLWYGLLAPAKTPRPIIDLLHQTLTKVLAEPEIKAKFHELSAMPSPTTPAEFTALIKSDLAKYAAAVKASGAKVE